MASEVLINITREDIEWARKLSEEKYLLDTQSERVYARKQGRAEGLAEGLTGGKNAATLDIAKNALAEGAALEFVSKITGLDLETVKQLAEHD